jgi:hypothetical protein
MTDCSPFETCPVAARRVCEARKTGSERRAVKVTRLTRLAFIPMPLGRDSSGSHVARAAFHPEDAPHPRALLII